MVDGLKYALSALIPTMIEVKHIVSTDVEATSEKRGGRIWCGCDSEGVCGGGDGVGHRCWDDGAVEDFAHNSLKYVKKSDGEEECGGELNVEIGNRCGKILSNTMLSPIGVVECGGKGDARNKKKEP